MNNRIEEIKAEIAKNDAMNFEFNPVIREGDFKSQNLKNIVSRCYSMKMDFLPHIAADLFMDEMRKRNVTAIENEMKSMSVEMIFGAYKEVNGLLLRKYLKQLEEKEAVESAQEEDFAKESEEFDVGLEVKFNIDESTGEVYLDEPVTQAQECLDAPLVEDKKEELLAAPIKEDKKAPAFEYETKPTKKKK